MSDTVEAGQAAEAAGEPLRFSHTLRMGPFVGLSLKNGLLNLVTLTLYRFWGRTEVRRRAWAEVRLNDEPFEYTGRGMELFLGFLIATLVIVPFLLLVFAVQFLNPLLALPLLMLFYLGMFFLWGYGTFTAMRYVASRTRWRGVRFGLRGSPTEYGVLWLAFAFAKGFTLGWLSPVADMFMAGRLWGGLTFGDRPLTWSRANRENLYGTFAIGWVAVLVGYIVFVIAIVAVLVASGGLEAGAPEEPPVALILSLYPLALLLVLGIAAAFAPYHAALMREIAGSLKLDDARLSLKVKALPLLGLALTNVLLLIFTLGFAAPYVHARTIRFMVERLSADGRARLAEAAQAPVGPPRGEGIADALGIGPL